MPGPRSRACVGAQSAVVSADAGRPRGRGLGGPASETHVLQKYSKKKSPIKTFPSPLTNTSLEVRSPQDLLRITFAFPPKTKLPQVLTDTLHTKHRSASYLQIKTKTKINKIHTYTHPKRHHKPKTPTYYTSKHPKSRHGERVGEEGMRPGEQMRRAASQGGGWVASAGRNNRYVGQ